MHWIRIFLFNIKRLLTITIAIIIFYIVFVSFGYTWETMKSFFPMVSLAITAGLNELFQWIDKIYVDKSNSFDNEYIFPIRNNVTEVKSGDLKNLNKLSSNCVVELEQKKHKELLKETLTNSFQSLHEHLGSIHNYVQILEDDIGRKKPKVLKAFNKNIKILISDRWQNCKETTNSLSDYMIMIKEEVSEHEDKISILITKGNVDKIPEKVKILRKDINLFSSEIFDLLNYIKNKC